MHRFPQLWNLLLLESRNYICWRTLASTFIVREVLQFGGGKVKNTRYSICLKIACIFFKFHKRSNALICIASDKREWHKQGLAKIAEGAYPRRHAETSPVKVKDTHLMNNKLPPAEILCGEWQSMWLICHIIQNASPFNIARRYNINIINIKSDNKRFEVELKY